MVIKFCNKQTHVNFLFFVKIIIITLFFVGVLCIVYIICWHKHSKGIRFPVEKGRVIGLSGIQSFFFVFTIQVLHGSYFHITFFKKNKNKNKSTHIGYLIFYQIFLKIGCFQI